MVWEIASPSDQFCQRYCVPGAVCGDSAAMVGLAPGRNDWLNGAAEKLLPPKFTCNPAGEVWSVMDVRGVLVSEKLAGVVAPKYAAVTA